MITVLRPAETELETGLEREELVLSAMINLYYLQGKERKGTQANNKQRGQRGNVENRQRGKRGTLDPEKSKVPTPGSRVQGGTYVRNATVLIYRGL